MDQPYINQENQFHPIQENFAPIDNNQGQNQQYMNPQQPPFNTDQNIIPQEQPYYSSENNAIIEKPNDNYPPQNIYPAPINPQYPAQGVALPVQQPIPVNNYPPQIQTTQPNNYMIQPVVPVEYQTQYQYQDYQNITQIPHKGIYQTDANTFYISTGCCFKLFPFIFFFAGCGVFAISFSSNAQNIVIARVFGVIFALIGVFLFFKMYNNIYFIMGPNTLTVMKKALCGKQTKIYNPGELQRIEFNYNFGYNSGSKGRSHNYSLVIVQSDGKTDNIFTIGSSSKVFTTEEIGYFLYYINTHIQTNMRV